MLLPAHAAACMLSVNSCCPCAGLIAVRNRLAAHKAQGEWALPSPIGSAHMCDKCMVLPLCATLHASIEGGTAESSGAQEAFTAATAHMGGPADGAFFSHWLALLELEKQATKATQANIWLVPPPPPRMPAANCLSSAAPDSVAHSAAAGTSGAQQYASDLLSHGLSASRSQLPTTLQAHQSASARPAPGPASQPSSFTAKHASHPLAGRCVGNLLLQSFDGHAEEHSLYPFIYSFRWASQQTSAPPPATAQHTQNQSAGGVGQGAPCLQDQGFAAGDAAVLSVQDRHAAVNRSRVLAVSTSSITLACRARMTALESAALPRCPAGGAHSANILWRIDKDETESLSQQAVAGLLELCSGTTSHLDRLRGLIVHLKPPSRAARAAYTAEAAPVTDDFEAMLAAECTPLLSCRAHACMLADVALEVHIYGYMEVHIYISDIWSALHGRHASSSGCAPSPLSCSFYALQATHASAQPLPCRQQQTLTQQPRAASCPMAPGQASANPGNRAAAHYVPRALSAPHVGTEHHAQHAAVQAFTGAGQHTSCSKADAPNAQVSCSALSQAWPGVQVASDALPTELLAVQTDRAMLTAEQREVVRRVLAWDDYVLVRGLPGSGKTSTICAMAQVGTLSLSWCVDRQTCFCAWQQQLQELLSMV